GKLGQLQRKIAGQRGGNVETSICEGSERAHGSAELKHRNLSARMVQTFEVPVDSIEPSGHLEPKGNRRALLQPSAPGDERRFVCRGQASERCREMRQITIDQIERLTQLQHESSIDGVLACGAPMDEGGRLCV